ncbi:hypothetical protein IU447_03190 [Nocardia farcinica]|uniref:hypothetical protein n=1 Tax=Nocardia farcinica TaxID=37329 RepID=UPI001894245D|nr:hypothetical protein [Nocardia farcinica]MBF6359108.1 hypothetical protein [Nocardia farcinica]
MNGTAGRTALMMAAAAAVAVLGGCTDIERALNKGGDTPCREYVAQDPDTKRTTITKFVKERDHLENEPPGTSVDVTMVAVDVLCGAQRNAETPIKNADVAGIFLNK